MANSQAKSPPDDQHLDQRFAETRMVELDDSFSQQVQEIAFAAALLQSGIANERELAP